MSKLRMAAMAAMVACSLMLVGGTGVAGASTAQTATPLKQTVALTGTKGFKGTYTIQQFVAQGDKLYAVGTLTGKTKGGKRVTKQNVKIPATLAGQGAQASQLPVPPIIPTQGACQILRLNLGAIDLNLLGVRVRTNPINLLIEAVPGAGNLLGNLLCAVTNLLNPGGALPGGGLPVGQVAALLGAILALLGGLGG